MKTETYLPVFKGFYGSIFEPDETNEIDHINELRTDKGLSEIDFDDCEFNYESYYKDVSESLVNEVESELSEYVESIEFQKLQSPKYYNFENDSIHVIINPKSDAIINYIHDYKDEWKKYLLDNYKSCSGFISSYDCFPESDDWNDYNIINGRHQLGSALNFIAENEGINELDLWDWIVGNISLECTNYNELTK
tara:strand:+ start:112 stop:693 length:582 start_codon:yes stop_codon:yes gene_type:complete